MDNQGDKGQRFRYSIEELLAMPLVIPPYQRPYKWTEKNVNQLIDDIIENSGNKKLYLLKIL